MPSDTTPSASSVPVLLDVAHIKKKALNLAYAQRSPAQQLDLYFPEEAGGPLPVIVHIHGGAFRFGDKRDRQVQCWSDGIKRGYAVASINYRMSGEAIFPAALNDCKAAIRWLRGNASMYHLDIGRFGVVGGSAGGNLAEMVAASAQVAVVEDESLDDTVQSCAVQACISWFGPTDFLRMDQQLAAQGFDTTTHNHEDSSESLYMGGQITRLAPEWVQKANPITWISDDLPPMFVQHGNQDDIVPVGQSEILVAAIQERLGPERVTFEILDGAGHADELFLTPENMEKNFSFLDQHLK
ncbi:MAG: alpha/beta hydrolase [Anaerolineae bacterium]|jgi:acetyl esterase/lipase|nr:alpha/beta hydrolase [Anaerolineae bacterium]